MDLEIGGIEVVFLENDGEGFMNAFKRIFYSKFGSTEYPVLFFREGIVHVVLLFTLFFFIIYKV